MTGPAIMWFRTDLRLADNPALTAAAAGGRPVVALFILDDEAPGPWRAGGAARWWLHGSLERLAGALGRYGIPLTLRRGAAGPILRAVAAETGAGAVFWNRRYEPWAIRRDTAIKADLRAAGLTVRSFNGSLLFEPRAVRTAQDTPFRVFTPFWRACLAADPPPLPLPAPPILTGAGAPPGDRLESWRLLPGRPDWATGLRETWTPGEAGAAAALDRFADAAADRYDRARDRVDLPTTAALSPHLHWGELSPHTVWHRIRPLAGAGPAAFLRQLGWREFCHHLLHAAPDLPEAPLSQRFSRFPWAPDPDLLRAWQRGRTGYPLVDAGMRQLWQTGWMHNRARMVAASFLVKHLLQPWQDGQRWFWDTLVDADLANNAAGWQWVAGCGADAAPFFRIFNPVLQGERYDPDGSYVRRFVPELAGLPAAVVHRPWTASAALLANCGIRLGETYPRPLVDHGVARDRALAAFATLGDDA